MRTIPAFEARSIAALGGLRPRRGARGAVGTVNAVDAISAIADPTLLFALFCFAFPLLLRLYALKSPVPLNPDEAQWTVSARRIFDDPVIWRSNDLTTSGPLNGLAVGWPSLFGAVPSIFTSRLTGLVLQSGMLAGIAGLVRVDLRRAPANAAVLVATLLVGLQTSGSFVHYSSELVSLALLVGFAKLLAGLRPYSPAPWRWSLCGMAVSALPLAKLQSSVLAVLLGAVCVGRLAVELRRRPALRANAAAFVAGAAVPLAALVLPPFIVGEGRAVTEGYLLLGVGYGGRHTLALFVAFAPFIAVQAILFSLGLLRERRRSLFAGRADLVALALGLWPAAALTVWLPGRPFGHYGLYLVVGLPLAVALVQRGLPAPSGGRRAVGGLLAIGCLALAVHAGRDLPARAAAARALADRDDGFAPADGGLRSRPLYAWTGAAPGDALLLWGWEPRLTAYAGLKSADRAAHAEYLIRPNRGREYFRSRLLGDLAGSLPALVLDTGRPGYFFNNDADYDPDRSTLDSFPALAGIVRARYVPVGGGGRCASLSLRGDLAEAWRRSEVALASSVPALVGGSMTETCGDWWAPDPAAHASATLSPAAPEPVRQLWLLASRGGPGRGRGTTSARVTFVSATGERRDEVVRLFDYPSWTVVEGDGGAPMARIEVEPLASVGAGPAIAAVKAFRAPPTGTAAAALP